MANAVKIGATRGHRFIDQLKPGEQVDGEIFLVKQKDLRTTTNGSLYIHAVLMDRTGQLLARVWNATQSMYDLIPEGGFINVRGRTESYKGNLQFIMDALRRAEPGSFDIGDFLPRTERDIDEMWSQVRSILETIKNPHLLALIGEFVNDETTSANFRKAPAAVQYHHAYIGGLLEHTLNVLQLACRIFGTTDDSDSQYPEVSRDLVLAGVFLHDIAKTAELNYETSFSYTNTGQLVGHISLIATWIDRKVADVEQKTKKPFPEDVQNILTHVVLSHHGTREFGSPVLPACPEAFAIHYLDNIDAKIQMTLRAMRESKDESSDWTDYVRSIETRVFKKDVFGVRSGESAGAP